MASLATVAGQTTVTTLTSWSMVLAAVLGILVASGEFRHSSATITYLATPDRTRVLLAKMPAAALTGAVFGLLAAAISTGLGLAFIAGRGDAIVLGISAMLGHAAGAKLGGAAFGPAHTVTSGSPLPFAAAARLLIGVAALVSLAAASTTMQRDIT